MRNPILAILALCPALAAASIAQPASPSQPASKPAEKPAQKTNQTPSQTAKPNTAIAPVSRENNADWLKRHEAMNARAKQAAEKGDAKVLFIGDSITQGWEGPGKEAWNKHFAPMNAINLGISGDRTQHVLWRLDHGNIDGMAKPAAGSAPKLAVIMIGTNNSNASDNTAEEIGEGITEVVKSLRAKLPETKILILAIFPRNEKPEAQREKNAKASAIASKNADGNMVHYMDIGPTFLTADGTLSKDIMPDLLHLSPKGYELWAQAIEAKVKELSN